MGELVILPLGASGDGDLSTFVFSLTLPTTSHSCWSLAFGVTDNVNCGTSRSRFASSISSSGVLVSFRWNSRGLLFWTGQGNSFRQAPVRWECSQRRHGPTLTQTPNHPASILEWHSTITPTASNTHPSVLWVHNTEPRILPHSPYVAPWYSVRMIYSFMIRSRDIIFIQYSGVDNSITHMKNREPFMICWCFTPREFSVIITVPFVNS